MIHTIPAGPEPVLYSDLAAIGSEDIVVVPPGAILVLDTDAVLGGLVVQGAFTVQDGIDIEMASDWVAVIGGGEFQVGTELDPHVSEFTLTLTGDDPDQDVNISEILMMSGQTMMPGMPEMVLEDQDAFLMVMGEGSTLNLHSADAEKTAWTQLDGTVQSGSTSMTMTNPTGWDVGDKVVIGSTDFDLNQSEEVTITGVSDDGTTFEFEPPLEYMHYGSVDRYDDPDGEVHDLDMRAEVGLVNRNIKIQGDVDYNEDLPLNEQPDQYGGHTMIMNDAEMYVSGVEFAYMGQAGILGKYPVHWHELDDASGQYITNSSVHHSFNKGITVHNTDNTLVADNFVNETISHNYYLEGGDENGNLLTGNLGMGAREVGAFGTIRGANDDAPSNFYTKSADNTWLDNHAAGSEDKGFYFALSGAGTNRDFGTFEGNAAHSTDGRVFYLNHGGLIQDGNPDGDAGDPQKVDPWVVEGFTAYKADLGLYVRGIEGTFTDSVFAEMGSNGRFRLNQTIEDSLIVGRSDNVGNPRTADEQEAGRSLPGGDGDFEGWQLYDGPAALKNVMFEGFEEDDDAIKVSNAIHKTSSFGLENITWGDDVAESAKFSIGGGGNAYGVDNAARGLVDVDGSITGVEGAMIYQGSADRSASEGFNAGSEYEIVREWGAIITTSGEQSATLTIDSGGTPESNNGKNHGSPFENLGATRSDGEYASDIRQQIPVFDGYSYEIAYTEPEQDNFRLYLHDADWGQSFIVNLGPTPDTSSFTVHHPYTDEANHAREVSSMDMLEASPDTAVFRDDNGEVHIKLVAQMAHGYLWPQPGAAAEGSLHSGVTVLVDTSANVDPDNLDFDDPTDADVLPPPPYAAGQQPGADVEEDPSDPDPEPTPAPEPIVEEAPTAMYVTGHAMQWHKLTLNFEGPTLSEGPETFLDHRLDVTFTHEDGTVVKVPGYFAADGDAANSGATEGNLWQVNFNPPLTGNWTWSAEFRVGDGIAVSNAAGQSGGFFDGDSGSLSIAESDKDGLDLRGKGVLEYDGGQYLSFAGTGETFLKSGVGSPENFLGYSGFDDTPDSHDYAPHIADFNTGDPTWGNGEGQGIIGAVNYLAEHEVNSAYMMLMNIAGDGRDVSPWTDTSLYDVNKNATPDLNERAQSFDVSKLAQWEIVFGHMQENGIALHLFLQETENDQLLNDGELGTERMLYMREMVARFGHHNGLIWNLGEENTNTTSEIRDHSAYLKELDPYGHAVALHTYPNQHNKYEDYQGEETLDVLSFQTSNERSVPDLDRYLDGAEDAGRPVAAFLDEPGNAGTGLAAEGDPNWEANHANLREVLWKSYAEGAGGAEWYFGYQSANGNGGDLEMEDFRLRESAYEWAASAREFFEQLPLEEMRDGDNLTSSTETHGLALDGVVYAYYLPDGGTPRLDLNGQDGTYKIGWYDVIEGGDLKTGTVAEVSGDGVRSLGQAPSDTGGEWAVMIWNEDRFDLDLPDNPTPPPAPDPVVDVMWQAQDGKIVMQAEKGVPTDDANPGNSDWKISDDLAGHTGDGYLHWDGPNLYREPGSGALSYEFEVSEGGEYKLGLLGSRPNNGEASDLNNDFWVRMDGGPWKKVFFSGQRETWNWGKTFDVNHEKSSAEYDLEPGTHVLEISGRSEDAYLDKIHLSLGRLDENRSAPETLADQPSVPENPDMPDEPDTPTPPDMPTPPPEVPAVTLRLVDVETGETISTLVSGDTLDPAFIGNDSFTIVADIEGDVGSVRFTLGDHSQVENVEPYALFGDRSGDFFAGDAPPFADAGDYALKVELFGGRNASGGKLAEIETAFSVEDAAPPPPPPAPEPEPEEPPAPEEPEDPNTPPADPVPPEPEDDLTSVFLVDTRTDTTLMELGENTILHNSVLEGRSLSVAAEVDETQLDIESARLSFDGTETRIENVEPYALFGNRSDDFLGALDMTPDATHEIGIDYYAADRARGDLLHNDTFGLEIDGNDRLSGRADDADLFGIDASKLGQVSIHGFASGDSVADVGTGLVDLLSQGEKVGDDWVVEFGGGNRLTLLDYDAESDPLLAV